MGLNHVLNVLPALLLLTIIPLTRGAGFIHLSSRPCTSPFQFPHAPSPRSSSSFATTTSRTGFPCQKRQPLFQQKPPDSEAPSPEVTPSDQPSIPPPAIPRSPNYKTIAALVAGELLLGLLAFPLGHVFKINPLATAKAASGFGPLAAVSALLTLPALLLHLTSGREIEDMLRESLEGIFGSDTAKKRPAVVIAISVLLSLSAGMGEEVAFRGALQPIFAQATGQPMWGLGISSLIFAALHAATPRYFLLALVLSVYLGCLQLRYCNLWVPILVHTLFDVVGFMQNHFWGHWGRKTGGESRAG
ncbi:abortive infection protein [Nannochloropsis gaditana]|uniref:Abortive infection protein n=1 Tax=Nannochloropsis gaditana TaxID=72520 RepID=W7TQD9_9STRA|nr:abortive infection protein [Nannochloropsis gaditana]